MTATQKQQMGILKTVILYHIIEVVEWYWSVTVYIWKMFWDVAWHIGSITGCNRPYEECMDVWLSFFRNKWEFSCSRSRVRTAKESYSVFKFKSWTNHSLQTVSRFCAFSLSPAIFCVVNVDPGGWTRAFCFPFIHFQFQLTQLIVWCHFVFFVQFSKWKFQEAKMEVPCSYRNEDRNT